MQFNGVNNKEHQHSLVVSGFYICACVRIPCALHLSFYCMCFQHELSALFGVAAHCPGSFPHPLPPSFHCLFSVMGAFFTFLGGGSWLDCQDLPAMGEVSIQELAASSDSSWMSQAPNLHLVMQLVATCTSKLLKLMISAVCSRLAKYELDKYSNLQ